ncbi:MAG: lytic transglycosylase domain-containing protein [Spirochaetales bacterium]|nr:lytic transglycosylase domain-containing protein [Spirochaetales bacterium]
MIRQLLFHLRPWLRPSPGYLHFLSIAFVVACFLPQIRQRLASYQEARCQKAVLFPALPGKKRCPQSFILYRLSREDSPLRVAHRFNARYGTAFTPEQMFLHDDVLLLPEEQMEGKLFALPVLDLGVDRRRVIVSNLPALFLLEESMRPVLEPPFYELPGMSGVPGGDALIRRYARAKGVDVDLVRAILHMETTHGWYDSLTGILIPPRTIQPMNVNISFWSRKDWDRSSLEKVDSNIRAGVWIIKEIQRRTHKPSVLKIATLYNNLRAERTTVYGAQVERIYREKPWLAK